MVVFRTVERAVRQKVLILPDPIRGIIADGIRHFLIAGHNAVLVPIDGEDLFTHQIVPSRFAKLANLRIGQFRVGILLAFLGNAILHDSIILVVQDLLVTHAPHNAVQLTTCLETAHAPRKDNCGQERAHQNPHDQWHVLAHLR